MTSDNLHVVVFQSSTANDAFPKDAMFERLVKRSGFNYHDITVNSIREMVYYLLDLKELNSNAKIAHLVIRAHGHSTGMQIGNDKLNYINQDNAFINFITFTEILNSMSTSLASIFLHSCSVGKDKLDQESFAKYLSKKIDLPIFASNQIIKMHDLIIIPAETMYLSFPFLYKVSDDRKRDSDYQIVLFHEKKNQDVDQ
jgi:Domain of unknown function (DUF4347)